MSLVLSILTRIMETHTLSYLVDILILFFVASEFENLAIGVLDECYNEDEVLAEMLVEREIPKWGGMCALNLAAAGKAEKFLAHPCCQSSLNSIWKSRGMPGVEYWKVWCIGRLVNYLLDVFAFEIPESVRQTS